MTVSAFWALVLAVLAGVAAQLSPIDATAPTLENGFSPPIAPAPSLQNSFSPPIAPAPSLQNSFSPPIEPSRVIGISRLPLVQRPRLGQSTNNIPVTSERQFSYSIRLTFGTQAFDLCFDTGSSDVWVVSSSCSDPDCEAVPQYDASLLQFANLNGKFNLNYLMGFAEGGIASTNIQMGPFMVESQVFALVDKTSQLDLASTGTSGIAGFAFPATAAISPTIGATFFQNLISALEADNQFMAFHLSRSDSGSSDPNASLTLGILDPAFASDPSALAYSAVIRTGPEYDYWKLPMLGMIVNGSPFQISSSRIPGATMPIAVLDSGTTLILGSAADVRALYALFGSAVRYLNGNYLVRCTFAAVISLVLGDKRVPYPIHPSDIAWQESESDGWCTGGIQPNDNVCNGDWLLGDVFLRNVYVVQNASGPTIGLRSVTDPVSALAQFRAERGPDVEGSDDDGVLAGMDGNNNNWNMATGFVKRWEREPAGVDTYVFGLIAGGAGFVVGSLGVLGWRIWRGV
ncbi:aspartic peptidase domain-containing protein [Roridomyces roridus]|uniref:Aspartic peptidase domain-containing protein n=1 Tax=Roridomyces roridus TaxID=1738132 RepID=A0AAD7FQ54_9AGAR|nr:aspartic peptidase domain-containing protein [Roridomyces roridus]